MTNPPLEIIKSVNTGMFQQQPFLSLEGLKPLMMKVANFSRNYWPHIIAGVLVTAVIAGFVFTHLDKQDT